MDRTPAIARTASSSASWRRPARATSARSRAVSSASSTTRRGRSMGRAGLSSQSVPTGAAAVSGAAGRCPAPRQPGLPAARLATMPLRAVRPGRRTSVPHPPPTVVAGSRVASRCAPVAPAARATIARPSTSGRRSPTGPAAQARRAVSASSRSPGVAGGRSTAVIGASVAGAAGGRSCASHMRMCEHHGTVGPPRWGRMSRGRRRRHAYHPGPWNRRRPRAPFRRLSRIPRRPSPPGSTPP